MNAPREDTPIRGNLEEFSQKQLEMYARDLQQSFLEERRLSRELQDRNRQLEQRIQELTALNRLFQQHLSERYQVVETYRQVLAKLATLAEDARALQNFAQSQPLPELHAQDDTWQESGGSR